MKPRIDWKGAVLVSALIAGLLPGALAAATAAADSSKVEGKSKKGKKESGVVVKLDADGLEIKDAAGEFKFRLGGRIQADAAFHDEDTSSLANGSKIRRARIYFKGTVHRRWNFKSQFELSGGEVDIKDLYLQYATRGGTAVTVGNFKEPFALEEQTSSKNSTFVEAALPVAAFAPSRALGVGVQRGGDRGSFAAGFFGEPINASQSEQDQGFAFASRLSWAPLHDEGRILHLGLAAEVREYRDGAEIRFSSRPESSPTGRRLVRTRTLKGLASTDRYGFEMAATAGPFSVQGEYILTRLDRANLAQAELSGWYGYVSWFLTGESRPYSAKNGTFGRLKPRAKKGAWEIAARFSSLDLDDLDISGGQEENITVAVNWYPNANVRFMANYVLVNSVRRGRDDDPAIFLVRAQIVF